MKFVIPLAFSDPTHAVEMARTAEECGWDAVTVSDHVIEPEKIESTYPYSKDGTPRWQAPAPWPDPWVTIGAMAGATSRLRFFTNVYVLPMRNPFHVAKAVGTAAVLSGDRVALGIGVGWMKEEYELLGHDFHTRGRRADEMIEVIRKLWSGEYVEHHGRFYDFGRVQMQPAPRARIPIYVGGISEPALHRVATLGDGWISDIHSVAELGEIIAKIRRYRTECGRGDEALDIVGSAPDAFDLDGYRRMQDVGVTHLATMPWLFYGGSTESLEDKRTGMRRFAEDIIAKMR
ncbi:MAG: LLM class F420-dependent oxidoreductase [Myxococcota bacterium]